jgi:hypothetical protein
VTSWSDGPFDRVERLENLTLGQSLSENNGQSRRVCVMDTHPGWLFKEYRAEVSSADAAQLDRLIEQPATFPLADRELINRNTSWPVTRVITASRTIGVILPKAPSSFSTELRINDRNRTIMLPVDLLALNDGQMSMRGLPRLSLDDRVAVCSSIAAVGALFERQGLVYLDWSYANAFWSTSELAAYIIDVDGCSFGPRLQTETTGWADPLVPFRAMASNEVDRYRVALLVARCLTAERDIEAVLPAVERLACSAPSVQGVADHVVHALTVTPAAARPSLVDLSAALTDAMTGIPHQRWPRQEMVQPGSGVTSWKPVKRRPGHPPPAGPRPVSPPRTIPVSRPTRPAVRRPPIPVPPANDSDTPTAQFGLLLLGLLLFTSLLILIIVVQH